MNVPDFINRIARIQKEFDVGAKKAAQTIAVTGLSLIKDRIQKNGVKGRSYSRNRIPLYYLKGKELNAGGRQYIEEQEESVHDGSYYEFRVANGRQVRVVDLTFSSRMWNGFQFIRAYNFGVDTYCAETGGTDTEVDNKLGWAQDRYGKDVFDPTQQEQDELDEIGRDFLADFLQNALDE